MLTSTRKRLSVTPSEAVCKGISSDGGLFIFENAKDFDFSEELTKLDYKGLAEKVFSFVFDDYSSESIKNVVNNAYNSNNFEEIVGVKSFCDSAILELWHGPTSAFKDMALTALGSLMLQAKKNLNEKEDTIILTATSGDTGSATLSGFAGTGINAYVLYPNSGVSKVQEAQMLYYAKNGSRAIAVNDNFDFCQALVKKVFTDKSIKLKNEKFSSANSINIGRLVPQIVYYIYSYCQLVNRGEIKFGDKVNFSVPTGNFGNILAGYLAKEMGLPINKLICASNKNDVLTDFFKTGIYDRKREFFKTISPSMDILVSSNLERLLYLLSDGDFELINNLMNDLSTKGNYVIPSNIKSKFNCFYAAMLNDDETEKVIGNYFEKNKYLLDPHTAVAMGAYYKYQKDTNDKTRTIIVSTASPFKFPDAVADALKINKKDDIFDTIQEIEKVTGVIAPKGITKLKTFKIEREVWSKTEAEDKLKKLSGAINV